MTKRADSFLPSDSTPSLGSNYGLDGFEDDAYNEGVEDRVTLSQYGEFPAFPTGITKGAAAGLMDLTELTREAATLSNLSWLEDAFQDVERLPKNPVDRGIPELEDAWGLERPTNGVLVPARDLKQARYEDQTAPVKKAHDPRLLQAIVTKAMRRSAAGHRLDDILHEAYAPLGDEGHVIKAAMDLLKSEHGLAGNVFIRASAYPGYEQGKWTEHVRKTAKDALYVVVDPEIAKSASWIVDGRCSMTGKTVVASVPWADAYAHYAPRLRLVGHRVASTGDHRTSLRQAFLTGPERAVKATDLPVHVTPSERVSVREAKAAVAGKRMETVVLTEAEKAQRTAALRRLAALHRAGALDKDTVQRIATSNLSPNEMLVEATRVATLANRRDYTGAVAESHVPLREAKAAADLTPVKQAREDEARRAREASKDPHRKALHARLASLAKSNVITEEARVRLTASTAPIKDVMMEVVRMARATQRDYAGPVIEQHVALRSAKQAADLTMAKFGSTLRWVRQAMSEGFAGRDLTSLIESRFANDVLAEARPVIDQTRKAHEGASGFIYVDAAAYASDRGAKGCEEGAVKHRTNTIRTVLAMDRCSTCAHARSLEDGTVKCGIYAKVLASAEDFGTDLDRIKTANIKTVNSSDAEVTASLFAKKFDQNEFSLHNATMTGFDLAPLPEHEKMGEIALGGLLWSRE